MNKTLRKGIDIRVAIKSNIKQSILNTFSHKPHEASTDSTQPISRTDIRTETSNATSFQLRMKGFLKKYLGYIYRSLKPIFTPIAFRVRLYLIEGLRQEILHEIYQIRAVTSQELQAVQDSLHREIAKAADESQRHIQQSSSITKQELQTIRDSLHREIAKAADESQRHIQQSSSLTKQELQGINKGLLPRLDKIEQYVYATARRVAVNCDPGEILIRTVVGYMVCASNDPALLACLMESGDLEMGTRLLIQRYIKPDDVYIDVGANIGIHTLAAARAMKGRGKIIAFEPFEPTKRMLDKTLWINGFAHIAEIHQAAVSSISGNRRLYLGRTSGHHSMFPLKDPINQTRKTVKVPVVRLDETMPPGQKIDLMKIDVEGAELEVIKSGESLISSNPDIALIVEFGPEHLRRRNISSKHWFQAFTKLGLSFRVINDSSGTLEESTADQLQEVGSVNLFFSRNDSSAWSRLKS